MADTGKFYPRIAAIQNEERARRELAKKTPRPTPKERQVMEKATKGKSWPDSQSN